MKHVSKQGRKYVRVTTEVHDESLKCWYGKDFHCDEEADNPSGTDDDESLLVSPFALKSGCESQLTEPPKKKTERRISDFQHFHWLAGYRLSLLSKIQLVDYHQCCVLIG